MGDSLMAWHGSSGRSISHVMSRALNEPVQNNAVSGARIIYSFPVSGALGLRISNQLTGDSWDWVVLNGGGNDLWWGCGCGRCERRLNQMISSDGSDGHIPDLIADLQRRGARVVYVGYLRHPGNVSLVSNCKAAGDQLDSRIAKLASIQADVYFLSNADRVPYGDRSYHAADMIHPSLKASAEIGRDIARLIAQVEAEEVD